MLNGIRLKDVRFLFIRYNIIIFCNDYSCFFFFCWKKTRARTPALNGWKHEIKNWILTVAFISHELMDVPRKYIDPIWYTNSSRSFIQKMRVLFFFFMSIYRVINIYVMLSAWNFLILMFKNSNVYTNLEILFFWALFFSIFW